MAAMLHEPKLCFNLSIHLDTVWIWRTNWLSVRRSYRHQPDQAPMSVTQDL